MDLESRLRIGPRPVARRLSQQAVRQDGLRPLRPNAYVWTPSLAFSRIRLEAGPLGASAPLGQWRSRRAGVRNGLHLRQRVSGDVGSTVAFQVEDKTLAQRQIQALGSVETCSPKH